MKLKDYFNSHPERIYYYFGILILLFGAIYCIIDFFYENRISIIGSVLVSIGIAYIAGGISRKSEKMTSDIGFSSFYDSLNTMRERRLNLRDKLFDIEFKISQDSNYLKSAKGRNNVDNYVRYLSYTIWLSKVYLDRAIIFKTHIRSKEKKLLIHFIDNLFIDLCDGKWKAGIKIDNNYGGQLEDMYNTISKFHEFNKEDIKGELQRERILNNLKFLKGLTNKVIYFNSCRIFK